MKGNERETMSIFEALDRQVPARRVTAIDKWLQTLSIKDAADFEEAVESGQYTNTALYRVAQEYGYSASFTTFRTWVNNVNKG